MTKRSEDKSDDLLARDQPKVTSEGPGVYTDQGWSCIGRREYDQAIAAFEKALSLDSRSMDAEYGLGAAFNAKGDTARARQAFEQIVTWGQLNNDPKAFMLAGLAQWALRKKG